MPYNVRVADEVWIAAAALHRSHPGRVDFTIDEIMRQAEVGNVTGVSPLRPGVKVHVYLHCVANRPPNPGRYRMLLETPAGRRRLFRPGDPCHPLRTAGKSTPVPDQVPMRYRNLIEWYFAEYAAHSVSETPDPVLTLRGLGKTIWADEDADDFVRRQRAGWQ